MVNEDNESVFGVFEKEPTNQVMPVLLLPWLQSRGESDFVLSPIRRVHKLRPRVSGIVAVEKWRSTQKLHRLMRYGDDRAQQNLDFMEPT